MSRPGPADPANPADPAEPAVGDRPREGGPAATGTDITVPRQGGPHAGEHAVRPSAAPAPWAAPIPAPRDPDGDRGGPTEAATSPSPAGLPTGDVPGLYPPAPTGRTEPLAGWALLLGILLPPVGVGVGLTALHRIRRRAADGRGLAVAGIVVGALISAVVILVLVLSALVGVGGSGGSGGETAPPQAVSQTCSGTICTVTARGAPVTVDGVGAGGGDGVTVLAIGEGSAAVASPQGPLEVPTGTALELERGTQVVLTQASADTVVFVYER